MGAGKYFSHILSLFQYPKLLLKIEYITQRNYINRPRFQDNFLQKLHLVP